MNGILKINQWVIELGTGDLRLFRQTLQASMTEEPIDRLDPKGVHLLVLLAQNSQQLVAKDYLLEHIWPGIIVTEDALTRCVSRLRKSLCDDPKNAKIIETLPKRGYRLIAETHNWLPQFKAEQLQINSLTSRAKNTATHNRWSPSKTFLGGLCIVVAFCLGLFIVQESPPGNTEISESDGVLSRADDHYLQMQRQDNEMAIELYQQATALRPESGAGQAGLANALVQQVLRWPNPASEPELEIRNLAQALIEGHAETPEAKQKLSRALALAQRAVRVSPEDARSHKALGFVYSAQREFDLALDSYARAVELDENAWDAMINIGDVLEISGKLRESIPYFEQAFAAMTRVYAEQTARIRPWYADLGAIIGDKYVAMEQYDEGEVWYRHVLSFAPFNEQAGRGLVGLLAQSGDPEAAEFICTEFIQRVGINPCER